MDYYNDIYRLAYIKRYSNVPKIHEESVAEHGFFVAAIVLKLYDEYKFNLGEALTIATAHDLTEMELNDCPHIIKKKYPSIAKAYQECEEDVARHLPVAAAWGTREFDKQETIESKIVMLADVMQCQQFTTVELKMGNEGYMRVVHERSKEREAEIRKELEQYERIPSGPHSG